MLSFLVSKKTTTLKNCPINLNCPDCALAVPVILDTNMKDGSRPESLDITYIVRGFANPPPQAIWTLNVRFFHFFLTLVVSLYLAQGKEIKPDGHLRMTASQNGEEFKLEILKLELKDAGVYECILTNPVGSVTQRAVLEVTREFHFFLVR